MNWTRIFAGLILTDSGRMPEEGRDGTSPAQLWISYTELWVSLYARIVLIKRTGMDRSIKPYFLPVFWELELLNGSPWDLTETNMMTSHLVLTRNWIPISLLQDDYWGGELSSSRKEGVVDWIGNHNWSCNLFLYTRDRSWLFSGKKSLYSWVWWPLLTRGNPAVDDPRG